MTNAQLGISALHAPILQHINLVDKRLVKKSANWGRLASNGTTTAHPQSGSTPRVGQVGCPKPREIQHFPQSGLDTLLMPPSLLLETSSSQDCTGT